MKNLPFFLLFLSTFSFPLKAQLVCVHCFHQNEAISPGASNRILNGGFENTNCTPGWFNDVFCPNSEKYNCDLENWQCTGGGPQSYPSVFDSTLSVIPEGNNAAYFGNGNAFSCSEQWGDTSCFKHNGCVITGIPAGYPHANPGYGEATGVSIEQNIPELTVGETYVLEFWAGGEPLLGLLSAPAVFAVDVGFGYTYHLCQPTGGSGNRIGTRYLIVFTATSNDHIIKFTNWGHTCIDCTELVIDDVSLYPLSELSSSVPECLTSTDEEYQNETFSVNPNPFSSEIIVVSKLAEGTSITLYDLTSRFVLEKEFTGTTTFNTSHLPRGLYFYKINSKNGVLKNGLLVKGIDY